MNSSRGMAVLAALLSACGTPTTTDESGSVQLKILGLPASPDTGPARLVDARRALDSTHTEAPVLAPITQVVISVVGPDGTPYAAPGQKIVVDSQFDSISRTFSALPVGLYTFSADAYGAQVASGSPAPLLFSGSTSYTVVARTTGTVLLFLRQVPPPGTGSGIGPIIRGITVDTGIGPVVGSTMTLSADVEPSRDTLTYRWTSACSGTLQPITPGGTPVPDSFSAAAAKSTTFTSYCLGTETLTFSVTATSAVTGSITATVQLSVRYAAQGAALDVAYDVSPDIGRIGIAPPGIIPHSGESVGLVAVVETHGAAATYSWRDDCGGAFTSGVSTPTPTWRAPVAPHSPVTCTLTLEVTKVAPYVGASTGTLTIEITSGVAPIEVTTETITEFPLPSGGAPLGIATGPDGNLWFTEYLGKKIGRITTGGIIEEFPIPSGGSPYDITAGPDGNMWFTELTENRIGRITLDGRSITEFEIPRSRGGDVGAWAITSGPDGNLWFTSGDRVGRITTEGITAEFEIPTDGGGPQGITTGPDGELWFTQWYGNKIGRITREGKEITDFEVSTPDRRPCGIAVGPDGNLWFTLHRGNTIGRITAAGVVEELSIPTGDLGAWGITAGPDRDLWLVGREGNEIVRIREDGAVTRLSIPTSDSYSHQITLGPDGNLWFTEYGGNKIGRLRP